MNPTLIFNLLWIVPPAFVAAASKFGPVAVAIILVWFAAGWAVLALFRIRASYNNKIR